MKLADERAAEGGLQLTDFGPSAGGGQKSLLVEVAEKVAPYRLLGGAAK